MEPWYEATGPDVTQVRKDVLQKVSYYWQVRRGLNLIKYEKEINEIIQNTILKVIPDTRNDFGSYRGYTTFGVAKEIADEIINIVKKEYARLEAANHTLQNKFWPYITHWLYKPGGLRQKHIAETTMVGKN